MKSFILCIWVFLLASPWTTPFAAEQAPVSPAPQNQIQPPPAPETKAPATPETKAPAVPETKAPAEPETKASAKPETKAPAVPETKAPAGPETKAPAKPETKAPPAPRAAPSSRPPERRLSPPPVARGDVISLNFNRADLVEVIHVLAQHLRLTYTIDPEVKGTVTIHSSEPLKREDLFPIFHQILRINGAVAVKTGDFYRIAPIKEGKAIARPVNPGKGKEDSYALQVVPVRFFSVSEMKKLLTPFLSSGGEIMDYPRGNFLIIVDLPSNIQKLMEIQELIDVNVFAGTRMEIYQPKVASAEELAAEMTKIMQSYASSAAQAEGFTAQFLPIPRINQLLVISHSEAAWTYAKRWLERIDVVAEGPGRRIFIYPVENGKAIELADVLNLALGRPPLARRDTPRTLEDLHRGGPRGTGVPGTLGTMGTARGGTGFGTGGTGLGTGGTGPGTQVPPLGAYAVAPTSPFEQPRPPLTPQPGAPPAPGAKPEEQLRIVPDPATNSLIIYGTAQEFQNIKNILKDLDQIPRQVLLDVLIAEVTLTDNLKFGVEYEIRRGARDTTILGRQFGSTGAIVSGILPGAPASGLTAFPLGLSSVISPTAGDQIRAFINALLTDSRVKVLSSPSVLATDNRPARIQVGSEIPILTGQTSTFVSGTQPLTSNAIQYRNTGVILTIIPQVNSQGLVHLQVKQEVSDVGAAAFGATSSPSFTTRDAETTGVVQDGETLVIGGIITERTTRDRTGIPYLMDIPVLGRFFGTTTDGLNRTELIMLITPHVIRDVDEARGVTDQFKEKLSNVTREINRMGSGNYLTSQP